MLNLRKYKGIFGFLVLALIIAVLPRPQAKASAHPAGSNVKAPDGTVYLITTDGQKRPYTSAGAFLTYGFNSWGNVSIASAEDLGLPTGSFIPPRDGKIFCSDRGADKGTCYLISGAAKAGFVSESVFKALGFSFSNAIYGDVSWLPSAANIENYDEAHLPGVLIDRKGTIFIVGSEGLIGIPSMEALTDWGYALSDTVPANTEDQAETQVAILGDYVPGTVTVISDPIVPISTGNITVLSPNGGEQWTRGNNATVDYTASNISKVDIRLVPYVACLHQPSGPTCALAELEPYTVMQNASATGHLTFLLDKDIQGRAIPAGQYLVEVASGAGEAAASDRSDIFFTINGSSSASAIKVLSPNGGETWSIGSTRQITWSASSFISRVNIYLEWGPCTPTPSQACAGFSIDAITLVKGTANDGSFDWVVGKDEQGKTVNKDSYLVRVEEEPFFPNYFYDYSDSVFALY